MGRLKSQGKSFEISKWEVWEAFRQVKANQGAAGVDGQSVADFEADLKNNLFKIWNRMSSGTYFPPAVRAVEIPKQHGGGMRMLGHSYRRGQGRPDRGRPASGVRVEPVFYGDSCGYRPGRSALDAVRACRDRLVHVLGVHVPATRGAAQGRGHVYPVPARDQQGRLEEDQRTGPRLAAAPQGRLHLRRARLLHIRICGSREVRLLPATRPAVRTRRRPGRMEIGVAVHDQSVQPGQARQDHAVVAGRAAILRPAGISGHRQSQKQRNIIYPSLEVFQSDRGGYVFSTVPPSTRWSAVPGGC